MIGRITSPDLTIALARQVQQARRSAAAASLEVFCKAYLPHYFTLPMCSMHRRLVDGLERASAERNARIAIASPRGHGKTALVAIAYCLWSVVCRGERHALLIGATQEDRRELLDAVRAEVEGNEKLRRDFPRETTVSKRSSDIQTRSGSKISALGRFGRVRGRRHSGSPPTLVVMDELEPPREEGEEGFDLMHRLEEWADEWIAHDLASGANVVAVGSIVRERSFLAELVDHDRRPEWTKLAFKAEGGAPKSPELWKQWERIHQGRERFRDATGPAAARAFYEANQSQMRRGLQPLWRQKADGYALRVLRSRLGPERWECEMQNDPVIKGESWRTAQPLECGDHYDRTMIRSEKTIEDTETHWRFVGVDPDVDLPLSARRWPDYVRIEINKMTGAKRIYSWQPDRRRIHPMAPALVIKMAAKRRMAGMALMIDEERAVAPSAGQAAAAALTAPAPN